VARKKFILNLPFRQIRKSDCGKPFANDLSTINKVTLCDLVPENRKNNYVFVYDVNGDVLAFLAFHDTGTHFHLDLAETNRMFETDLKPGRKLVLLVEEISAHLGYDKITLYSVENKISLYKCLGYRKTGKTLQDDVYGVLTEMEKPLS